MNIFLSKIQATPEGQALQATVDFSRYFVIIGLRIFATPPFMTNFEFTSIKPSVEEIDPQQFDVTSRLSDELNQGPLQRRYHVIKVERPDQALEEHLFNFNSKALYLR